MAIPISEYIDIRSRVLQGTVRGRDFSGLVISADEMKETVPEAYAAIKTRYTSGKPVALGKVDVAACFDSTTDVAKFATKYFGFSGGNHAPAVLNVAFFDSDDTSATAKSVFDAVTSEFTNFGAVTFVGDFALGTTGSGGILDVASAVEGSGFVLAVAATSSNASATASALANFSNTAVVVATPASGTNLGAWMFLAWYASADYTAPNASSSIDYVEFGGEPAEVDTITTKRSYDALHLNYIGLVQVYGQNRMFYQTGVNMDGIDSGVVRDRLWLESEIQAGWFNLNNGTVRVEASYVGAAKVRAMIVGVATRAIDNGVILIDKPLTEAQIAEIASLTGNATAADSVVNTGYYVDAKILPDGDRYVCQYTLVYAKGDHIGKVTGANYLV